MSRQTALRLLSWSSVAVLTFLALLCLATAWPVSVALVLVAVLILVVE